MPRNLPTGMSALRRRQLVDARGYAGGWRLARFLPPLQGLQILRTINPGRRSFHFACPGLSSAGLSALSKRTFSNAGRPRFLAEAAIQCRQLDAMARSQPHEVSVGQIYRRGQEWMQGDCARRLLIGTSSNRWRNWPPARALQPASSNSMCRPRCAARTSLCNASLHWSVSRIRSLNERPLALWPIVKIEPNVTCRIWRPES